MLAELGLFCLILAMVFAILLAIVPPLALKYQQPSLQKVTSVYLLGQFFFVTASLLCLALCFLQSDFTVIYVLNNSSLHLPWFYKLCAVWGGHEGSMLLWLFILSAWMMAVSCFSSSLDAAMRIRVLAVLAWVSIGFFLFILLSSNPFLRQFSLLNSQGRDLNPLLQDPGFLFHPPMLYMGYVGLAVPFAFAIAALWAGSMESSWTKWTRPWTLAAWCCLTAGITLGSWWAYRELGWGGWWFWDPVENASFMPWLLATALIHSLAVAEKRQQFRAWTVLLAIGGFSLSLVGTFLVRSGVLTSVHAFAVDPERGLFILLFLSLVIGGSLLLFALRSQSLQNPGKLAVVSRETALLLNNVILLVAMLTVLLGTLYPLLIDALGLGKLSVGAPYFNSVFIPLMIPLLILMGLGSHLRWQQDKPKRLSYMAYLALASFMLPWIFLFFTAEYIDLAVILGLSLAFWVLLCTFYLFIKKLADAGFAGLKQGFLGMLAAHCGMAITVIGIAVSTGYGEQQDVRMQPGSSLNLKGYLIRFLSEAELQGPNYHGSRTTFSIAKANQEQLIYPEKRVYDVGKMPMTEAAIDVNPFRDLYIALGEPLDETAWSLRIYYKPFVRWIWAGGFVMLFGGLLALSDRRYFQKRKHSALSLDEVKA